MLYIHQWKFDICFSQFCPHMCDIDWMSTKAKWSGQMIKVVEWIMREDLSGFIHLQLPFAGPGEDINLSCPLKS